MEPAGALLLHHGGFSPLLTCRRPARQTPIVRRRTIVAVSMNPKVAVNGVSGGLAAEKTVYHDSWFDRIAIRHLSQSVQAVSGENGNGKDGYDGLIDAASAVSRNFGAKTQQFLVIEALQRAFPSAILSTIKTILPPSRISREYFAIFTTLFFPWLVGPCEVRDSEFQGTRERNVVYIPKCRFLESTNCVGMCTNLCKVPSETFIKESLGMPIHMVPNFEDMSCEMIFGQHPPADDPAMKQPCYHSLCIAKQTQKVNCSS